MNNQITSSVDSIKKFTDTLSKGKKILIAFLVIVIFVSAILKALTPKKVVVRNTTFNTTNFDGSKSQILDIQFQGEPPLLPKKLSIAAVEQLPQTAQDVVDILSKNYNLSKNNSVDNVWEGREGGLLTQDPYSKEYTFFFPYKENNDLTELSPENLTEKARSFMINTFSNTDIIFISSKIEELPDQEELSPIGESNKNGELFLIPFSYKIDGEPVFFAKNSLVPFRLTLDKRGNFRTLRFTPNFFKFSPIQNKDTISVDQAINNIKKGQASIITSYSDELINIDIKKIKKLIVSSVEIEYRPDQDNGFAYPFFRLSGTATNEQNTLLKVEVITPAIETEL
jgi:hypothetical protein